MAIRKVFQQFQAPICFSVDLDDIHLASLDAAVPFTIHYEVNDAHAQEARRKRTRDKFRDVFTPKFMRKMHLEFETMNCQPVFTKVPDDWERIYFPIDLTSLDLESFVPDTLEALQFDLKEQEYKKTIESILTMSNLHGGSFKYSLVIEEIVFQPAGHSELIVSLQFEPHSHVGKEYLPVELENSVTQYLESIVEDAILNPARGLILGEVDLQVYKPEMQSAPNLHQSSLDLSMINFQEYYRKKLPAMCLLDDSSKLSIEILNLIFLVIRFGESGPVFLQSHGISALPNYRYEYRFTLHHHSDHDPDQEPRHTCNGPNCSI
jgi:hypothetical protein